MVLVRKISTLGLTYFFSVSVILTTLQQCRSDDSVSMSLVASSVVSDLTRVEARVGIHNPATVSQNYLLELFRESTFGTENLLTTTVSVPAGEQLLVNQWISTSGQAGTNTIRYRVTPDVGTQLTGESSFRVAASATRAVPIISTAWIDPGAMLPGVYPQRRPVTAQDIRESIDAASEVGIDTLVITYSEYILNGWGTFYPSLHYESLASFDVIGTILNQASQNGQRVFVGLGRGDDLLLTWDGFDDPDRISAALQHGEQIATEIWDLYHHEPSFYGWYLTHEANDILKASNAYYNPMTERLREFSVEKPVMISPSGTPIVSATILENSLVDIFAYQDAVGAGYVPYENTFHPQQRIDMLDAVYGSYRAVHEGVDKHLWTNLEAWEMVGPLYANAFPAEFHRVLQQLEIQKHYVDSISTYEWLGFFEHPDSAVALGGPSAIEMYTNYRDYYLETFQTLKLVNYVQNPGFELGLIEGSGLPTGWNFFGNGIDQVVSLSPSGALGSETAARLDINSNSGFPFLTQDIPVVAGAEYKFSAWVKQLISAPSQGWLSAHVWMLSDAESGMILESTSLLFSDDEWQLQSSYITAPSEATIARIVISIQDNSYGLGISQYLVDNINLAGPELVLPGDFNRDFVVDSEDLLFWQSHFGAPEGLNGSKFLAWQRNLGAKLNNFSLPQMIPEPSTLTTSFFSLCGVAVRFRLGLESKRNAIAYWASSSRS